MNAPEIFEQFKEQEEKVVISGEQRQRGHGSHNHLDNSSHKANVYRRLMVKDIQLKADSGDICQDRDDQRDHSDAVISAVLFHHLTEL